MKGIKIFKNGELIFNTYSETSEHINLSDLENISGLHDDDKNEKIEVASALK